MNGPTATRVRAIKPSPTMVMTDRAAALRAAGRDVIGLSAGEPDFDTPTVVREAAVAAIAAGETHYTPVDGTARLKTAIIAKFERENGLDYRPDQVLVSSGCKQSLYNLTQALLDPGDEVAIPAPCWVSYTAMAQLAGALPRVVPTTLDAGFKLSADQLAAALGPRTRLVILNSPCNPTGAIYDEAELAALAEVLLPYPDVVIATDDIYEHVRWSDTPFRNIVNVCPELKQRTVVLNGVSKAYAMTGWRIGYAAGPAPIIAAMKTIQSQSTSCPNSIAQAAAAAALDHGLDFVRETRPVYRARHDFLVAALGDIPGVRIRPSHGAFYAFPDVTALLAARPELDDDVALAEFLLDEALVATVPGSAFEAPGHLRLSFATSVDRLREAMARITAALDG